MIPVIASTKIEKLKIDLAGVDSGAKMLVWELMASALGANKRDERANIASSLTARIVIEFVLDRICLQLGYGLMTSACASWRLIMRSRRQSIW
jgi:hypothetical protein